MRQKRTAQATIYEVFSDHELGRELQTMSMWLDAHRSVLTAVMNDLCRRGLKPTANFTDVGPAFHRKAGRRFTHAGLVTVGVARR